jgi:hypothetical protein
MFPPLHQRLVLAAAVAAVQAGGLTALQDSITNNGITAAAAAAALAYWVKAQTARQAFRIQVFLLAAAVAAVQAALPPPMVIRHPAPWAAHMEVAALAVGITPRT